MTKQIAPHTHLPASQWRQWWNPGNGGGSSGNFNNTNVPAQIIGVGGTGASISLTPQVNCFWEIDSQSIWHTSDAAWSMIRVHVRLIGPADLDGLTTGSHCDAQQHSAIEPWCAVHSTDVFRLAAGTAYAAQYWMASSTNHNQHYWTGSPYLRLEGRTFGHGSF